MCKINYKPGDIVYIGREVDEITSYNGGLHNSIYTHASLVTSDQVCADVSSDGQYTKHFIVVVFDEQVYKVVIDDTTPDLRIPVALRRQPYEIGERVKFRRGPNTVTYDIYENHRPCCFDDGEPCVVASRVFYDETRRAVAINVVSANPERPPVPFEITLDDDTWQDVLIQWGGK